MLVLGDVPEILFSLIPAKEAAGDPTLCVAWLQELIKEPSPVSVSCRIAPRRWWSQCCSVKL